MSSATAISAGEAYVSVSCDNSALIKGLQEVAAKIDETSRIVAAKESNLTPDIKIDPAPTVNALREIRDATKEVKDEGKGLNVVFAATATDIINFFKGAMTTAANLLGNIGDQFDKMSQRVGVSTEALSEYGHAATMCGGDVSNIEGALKSMATLTLNAANGQTKATATFKRLGVEIESFQRMTPEEQFDLLASKIASIEDPTKRAAEAMKVFGSDGQKLLPLFNAGADGLAEMREEARRLGVSIDEDSAKMGADFTDASTRLKESLKGVGLTIANALTPTLISIFNSVAKIISVVTQWTQRHPILTQSIIATSAAIVAWIAVVQSAQMAAGKWSDILRGLKKALVMLQALTGASTALGVAATAGLAVAGTALIAYLVRLKMAVDETERLANAPKTEAQDALSKGETERAAFKSDLDELETLRRKQAEQKLSTEELARAAEIVAGMKSKYKDVGYEVDVVNGKIKAATGAQEKLTRAMLEQKKDELRKAIAEKQDNIHSGKLMREMADAEVSDAEAMFGKQRGSFKMNWAYSEEIGNGQGGLQSLADIKVWQLKLDSEFKKKYIDARKKQ